MNRQFVVAATILGIAACATPGPETPVPSAKVETSVITSTPTVAEGEFEDIDVPEVPKMTNIPAQASNPDPNELICRRERITGSHRVTRVCRKRAQIEARRVADQEAVRKMGTGIRK